VPMRTSRQMHQIDYKTMSMQLCRNVKSVVLYNLLIECYSFEDCREMKLVEHTIRLTNGG
jgi:hypothetical protein